MDIIKTLAKVVIFSCIVHYINLINDNTVQSFYIALIIVIAFIIDIMIDITKHN